MSTLTGTIAVNDTSGLPWWAILLIVIGCVLLSVGLMISMYYGVKYHNNKQAESNVGHIHLNLLQK